MLKSKPETISFLRGLYGEVQALEGALAGHTPREATTVSSSALTLWEKQDGKSRYIVAMLGANSPPAVERVTFTIPTKAARAEVLFEGRTVGIERGQVTDIFAEPYTVRVYRLTE